MAQFDTVDHKASIDGRVAVAIPVHNEASLITPCLMALARQSVTERFDVVVLLNNCSDGTEIVVERLSRALPYRLQIHEYWLDPAVLNAGVARRLAMLHAASFVGATGVLLTTDADACVPEHWIESNLRYIDAGCDAVAGMTHMDPEDEATLPTHLGDDEARVMAYATLLDEIDSLLDPCAHDPFPRHTERSGASIAVRADVHNRAGGFEGVASGEDRRFFQSLRQLDAKIRHASDIVVTVSGRLTGRAHGGMAETMARRMQQADVWLDEDLESAARQERRTGLRAALRRARTEGVTREGLGALASSLNVTPALVERALLAGHFGAGWAELERLSPTLMRVPVRAVDLMHETAQALQVLRNIKAGQAFRVPGHPADTEVFAHGADSIVSVAPPE